MIMGNAVEGNHDYDRNMDHLGWSGQFHIVIKLSIAGMGLTKDALWFIGAVYQGYRKWLRGIHGIFLNNLITYIKVNMPPRLLTAHPQIPSAPLSPTQPPHHVDLSCQFVLVLFAFFVPAFYKKTSLESVTILSVYSRKVTNGGISIV